jgi:hypothetical protein
MLATHKRTPLRVSHSSQDATPVVSGKVDPLVPGGYFGPFFGSISLTAGAELLCSYSKMQFGLRLLSLPPDSFQVCVTQSLVYSLK